MCACESDHDNPQLVQGLLERKARARTRDRGGWDALMYASDHGNIAVCHELLDRGADPDSNNQEYSALSLAASLYHLQLCQLFISRRANLMLVLTGGSALQQYGEFRRPRLTGAELEQRRSTVLAAFEQGPHPDMCWKRRWPFVCVLVCCDFQPLAARKAHLLLINPPLPHDALIPSAHPSNTARFSMAVSSPTRASGRSSHRISEPGINGGGATGSFCVNL